MGIFSKSKQEMHLVIVIPCPVNGHKKNLMSALKKSGCSGEILQRLEFAVEDKYFSFIRLFVNHTHFGKLQKIARKKNPPFSLEDENYDLRFFPENLRKRLEESIDSGTSIFLGVSG